MTTTTSLSGDEKKLLNKAAKGLDLDFRAYQLKMSRQGDSARTFKQSMGEQFEAAYRVGNKPTDPQQALEQRQMHAVKKALLNETREIPDGQARNEGRSATGSIRLPDIEKPSDALSGTVRAAAKYSVAAPKPDATAMLSASPQQTNTAAAPVAPQNSSASSSDPNRGKIEASADRVYGDINQMKLKSYTQDSVIEILERERASVTKDIEKTGASIHTVSALRRTELGSHLAQNHWDNLEGGKKDPATINIRSGLQPDGKGPSASGTLEAGLPKNTGAHTAPSRAVATPKTDRRLGG